MPSTTSRNYKNTFAIITPSKGLEKLMPLKVKFELEADAFVDDLETEFDLGRLRAQIRETENDMAEEFPDDFDPSSHPDVVLMRQAYEVLETRQLDAA